MKTLLTRKKLDKILPIVAGLIMVVACGRGTPPHASRAMIDLPAASGIGRQVPVGVTVVLNADAVVKRVTANSSATPQLNWALTTVPPGSSATLSSANGNTPTFVADKPGTFIASLVVTAGNSRTRPVLVSVTASATPATTTAFDHSTTTAACITCHDGKSATGMTANHIATTDMCVACHSTVAWKPVATVDHSQVIGTCASCHDGVIARGKPATGHVDTQSACDTCHSTSTWMINPSSGSNDIGPAAGGGNAGAAFTHPNVTSGCAACHGGSKPATHIETTEICEACHTYTGWIPVVTVDHGEVLGSCSTCHSKPADHPRVTGECNTCHTPADWDIVRNGAGGAITHEDEEDDDEGDEDEDDEHYRAPQPGGSGGGGAGRRSCAANPTACPAGGGRTGGGTTGGGAGGSTGGTTPPPFVHPVVDAATVCASCHNGTLATGKPANHIATTSDCKLCHNTTAWK